MPPIVLSGLAWGGLVLLSLVFYANALGVVDQTRPMREIMETGASEAVARFAVGSGRIVQLVGATALFFPGARLYGAIALCGFLAAATVTAHAFWRSPPDTRGVQVTNFLRNLAILGGLLALSGWGH